MSTQLYNIATALQKVLVLCYEDKSQTTALGDSVLPYHRQQIEFLPCYLFATEAAFICSITSDQTGSVYS